MSNTRRFEASYGTLNIPYTFRTSQFERYFLDTFNLYIYHRAIFILKPKCKTANSARFASKHIYETNASADRIFATNKQVSVSKRPAAISRRQGAAPTPCVTSRGFFSEKPHRHKKSGSLRLLHRFSVERRLCLGSRTGKPHRPEGSPSLIEKQKLYNATCHPHRHHRPALRSGGNV